MALTGSQIREVLRYEPQTGLFFWRNDKPLPQGGWVTKAGELAGGIQNHGTCQYRKITVDGRRYFAHRLAWTYMLNEPPPQLIDHINGDGTDNRWANLRKGTKSGNAGNSRKQSNNTSGLKGVSLIKASGKWRAQISRNGEKKNLGHFDTPEAASDAYRRAAIQHFGAFARTI